MIAAAALWLSLLAALPFNMLAETVHRALVLPLSLMPLLYWLYRRFSSLSAAWADSSLASAILLLAVSGVVRIALALLASGTAIDPTLSTVGALIGLACTLVVGAHGLAPHADRSTDRLLSAPWAAAALVWLVLAAWLDTLLLLPELSSWGFGPLLDHARLASAQFAGLALLLGVANQIAAELRGENRRVTGWIPFWLVLAGCLLHVFGAGAAGLLSAYHAELLGIAPGAEGLGLITPFYVMSRAGDALILTGLLIFAVSYYWRRPRSTG